MVVDYDESVWRATAAAVALAGWLAVLRAPHQFQTLVAALAVPLSFTREREREQICSASATIPVGRQNY